MEYITSSNHELPDSARPREWGGGFTWWNLWRIKLWPYRELVIGDLIYFYESPTKRIVWKSRVTDVHRFHYKDKAAARRELGLSKSGADDSEYFQIAPEQGYGLFFEFRPIMRLNLNKPDDLRFPQKGWLRVSDNIAREWLHQTGLVDNTALDDIVPRGSLIEAVRQLNEEMVGVSPERVRSIVSQTIRRDTRLVKGLKELCGFRCQFPGCGMKIRKRGGGFYVEVAHIKPVGKGGRSRLGNLAVLCPNHHKEFDYGDLRVAEQTVESLRGKLNGKKFEIRLPGLT